MASLPQAIYRFKAIPIKIPTELFTDLKKKMFSFIWKHEKPRLSKTILNNERTSGGITILNFKLYYKAIVIQIKHGVSTKTDTLTNCIEGPDINPHSYELLIFDENKIHTGKKIASSTSGACQTGCK